jgi:hypothetical protein
MKKGRHLDHLSKEENEMLDRIADIIIGYVLRKGYEQQTERKRQPELNQYSADSEPIVRLEKKARKKRLKLKRFLFRTSDRSRTGTAVKATGF